MKKLIITLALIVLPSLLCSHAIAKTLVLDDSFTDGGRNNGSDKDDANWWTTSSSSAIEVKHGFLGLVSGDSGRGIRTTFSPQKLALGDSIKASFQFTTPATIGSDRTSSFRIGMYDKSGRTELESDLSASSKKPNELYNGLDGYMIDFDVNLEDTSKTNIDIRKTNNSTSGRLLGSTQGYKHLGGGGSSYSFEPEQIYTGVLTLMGLSNGVQISGSLYHKGKMLSTFSTLSENSKVNNIGMLAFHVNSKTFGSSKEKGVPDNGIDFNNVKVEVLP